MNDPLPGNIPLNKKDPRPSEKILELACLEFGLKDIQFFRKVENSVFSAKKADQDVFLRLTSRMRRNPSQIQAELKWIIYS